MIAVIDYGMGNLGSVSKALEFLGGDVVVTQKGSDLKKADKIVLPGVGAFRDAMDALAKLNLITPLKEEIVSKKIYLGICLGLELLFEKSEEGSGCEGLGILKGDVVRFSASGGQAAGLKVPQIGWNQVRVTNDDCPLFQGIDSNAFFYFVHSYYVRPKDSGIIAAVTEYGGEFIPLEISKKLTGEAKSLTGFTSMVWRDNIYAVQFHPEKSQKMGLKFLENFMRL